MINLEQAINLYDLTAKTYEEVDRVYDGLTILKKYCKKFYSIEGTDHDLIYSIYYPENGMLEEDVKRLAQLGWFIRDGEYWAIYV